MNIVVYLFLFAIICLFFFIQSVYLYAKRTDPVSVGKISLWSFVAWLVLTLLFFGLGVYFLANNKGSYNVSIKKMVTLEG